MNPMTADELRRAFLSFFEARGHTVVPAASLIPHDPDLLFTVAGMVPFKPYFLGLEVAPYPRVTTVQTCVRVDGKENDLEEVGRDASHLSFFEMLGNFSFGDYFKAEAVPMAWDMVTNLFGIDPDQLWVTVHTDDDEAEQLWIETAGVARRPHPATGRQLVGAAGRSPGPCGPNSEIFVDLGPDYGDGGGPGHGSERRFLEIWNLVFMQYNRDRDGVDTELPRKNIDTGAGLERILGVLQGKDSVWDIDVMVPLIETAQSVTGRRLGVSEAQDVSLRILAEHARTMSFLVSDGVFPSNEGRGYVVRRVIRRAVRHAYLLDVDHLVTPSLVDTTVEIMGGAYPGLVKNHDFVRDVVAHEEDRFRQTLKAGTTILDAELDALAPGSRLPGAVAFVLHDTHGFPLELTREITLERGVDVDERRASPRPWPTRSNGPRTPGASRARRPTSRPTRRCSTSSVRPSSSGRDQLRGGRAGAGRGRTRRRRPDVDRRRPLALLRRERRAGGRHRHHHLRHRSGRGGRHPLRHPRPPAPRGPPGLR